MDEMKKAKRSFMIIYGKEPTTNEMEQFRKNMIKKINFSKISKKIAKKQL
jgi:hypothetical protein